MQIAIISGSNRIGRQSLVVAEYLQAQLELNTTVDKVILLDVAEYNFPVMDERLGVLDKPHKGLQEFSDYLMASDGIVIVTPEYNGGMAGSLKNTLDYFRKEFSKKPMAAVTVSSGNFGGINALHQLWFWMLYNGGIVSPNKLLVSHVNDAFNKSGVILDERLKRNSEKFIEDLIWLTVKIKG